MNIAALPQLSASLLFVIADTAASQYASCLHLSSHASTSMPYPPYYHVEIELILLILAGKLPKQARLVLSSSRLTPPYALCRLVQLPCPPHFCCQGGFFLAPKLRFQATPRFLLSIWAR